MLSFSSQLLAFIRSSLTSSQLAHSPFDTIAMPKSFLVSAWHWDCKLKFHVAKSVTPVQCGLREDKLEAGTVRTGVGLMRASDWGSSRQMRQGHFTDTGNHMSKDPMGRWAKQECNNIFCITNFIYNFSSSFYFGDSGDQI